MPGFTGIATFGLAVLLAGENQRESVRFQKMIQKHLNEKAIQVLVKVEYASVPSIYDRDSRSYESIEVQDVQPLTHVSVERP